jgi:hypothetical protein
MSRRYDEARRLHASGGGELVARDVDPWPWSYYRNDVRADPGAGQNRCWADYFGIDGVRLESSASGESGAVARPLE